MTQLEVAGIQIAQGRLEQGDPAIRVVLYSVTREPIANFVLLPSEARHVAQDLINAVAACSGEFR